MKTLGKNKKSLKKKETDKKLKNLIKNSKKVRQVEEDAMPFMVGFLRTLLKEAEEEVKAPEDFTDDQNKQDFEAGLDAETPKDQYDIEGTNPNVVASAISKIHEWSNKLDEFAAFMNNPDSQSLHKLLATEDRPGSLLRGITRKASDSITRIAGEIAKLKETLNGFINMADKKQRDADINKMQ